MAVKSLWRCPWKRNLMELVPLGSSSPSWYMMSPLLWESVESRWKEQCPQQPVLAQDDRVCKAWERKMAGMLLSSVEEYSQEREWLGISKAEEEEKIEALMLGSKGASTERTRGMACTVCATSSHLLTLQMLKPPSDSPWVQLGTMLGWFLGRSVPTF